MALAVLLPRLWRSTCGSAALVALYLFGPVCLEAAASGSKEVGTCSATSSDATCTEADRAKGFYGEIHRRCVKKKTGCAPLMNTKALYEAMKACATSSDAEEDTECIHMVQEKILLDQCLEGDISEGCLRSMKVLGLQGPVAGDHLRLLATVLWQLLWTRNLEWYDAEANYDNSSSTFFLQPYRTDDNATYGRIAYGHRVTEKEMQSGRFMGGIQSKEAENLLREDYEASVMLAQKELGDGPYNSMPGPNQAVAADFAFRFGTTKGHEALMKALTTNKRKDIKKELLKKPQRWRSVLCYHEFIA